MGIVVWFVCRRALSDRAVLLDDIFENASRKRMTEVDPECLRAAPGDPAGHVGKIRDGNVHERPSGHRKASLDPAPQSRAVRDSHSLCLKLVRCDRRLPVYGNADGFPFVLRQP